MKSATSVNTVSWRKVTIFGNVSAYTCLIVLSFVVLVPLFWMITTALKSSLEIYAWPPELFPQKPLWNNFIDAWNSQPFKEYLLNSTFILVLGIVAEVSSEALVAYGFARFEFPGRDIIFIILLSTMMLPSYVTLIPTYVIWNKLQLNGNFDPLVLRAWTAWGPFFIFLLRQFFMGIPKELDDAAEIDGASTIRTFYHIMLPQVRPALLAVGIFAFRGYWNDFLGPLIYLTDKAKSTMTLGLYFFMGGTNEAPKWNYLMAVTIMLALPMIILFFIAQRYFIEGITFTGLKE